MIPHEKISAVTRGLREAFGVTDFEGIRKMTRGHTLVFRIIVRGSPFLLKIILRPNSVNPQREFVCMKAAADAGLAPHVRYTSTEDGISITDFVEEVPFPVTKALVGMPAALRTLHALSPFPRAENHINTTCTFLMNKGPALDGFLQGFRSKHLTKEENEELFAWHSQLAAVYPRHDADMVSSHNDLFKPDNILFDGNRVWLVDWEAAFLNDRYADLAAVGNFVVTNEAEERVCLQEYFGQPPDEYQRARFFFMQQVVHMFYTMGFLFQGSSDEPVIQTEKTPEFKVFHQRMWAGDVDLKDKATRIVFGRVHWEQLVQNMQRARFSEAVRIISDRHSRS